MWFHDLSAGPESWTENWNVDDADVDGDGVADYRLPPIWEYLTAGGYRAATELTADLARVTRFVAINLLFTSSPLYPPYLAPLRLPESSNLDVNTYEGWKGVDASQLYQTPALLVDELTDLHRIPYSSDQQDLAFKQGARNCFRTTAGSLPRRSAVARRSEGRMPTSTASVPARSDRISSVSPVSDQKGPRLGGGPEQCQLEPTDELAAADRSVEIWSSTVQERARRHA